MKMKTILSLGLFAAVAVAFMACSRTARVGFDAVNKTADGLAIRGYDAVAYFDSNNAVEGAAQYAVVWNGAKWLFSSMENLEKFRRSPEAFAPQFGGYCSYAVSKGYTADGDPNAWKIVNGKLYLNYSPEVKKLWEQDQDECIKLGERHWSEFKVKKPEHKS
jgi:YHS domain-containing protein